MLFSNVFSLTSLSLCLSHYSYANDTKTNACAGTQGRIQEWISGGALSLFCYGESLESGPKVEIS